MRMTMKEKTFLTKAFCEQYRKAPKKQKGIILSQVVAATGYCRSYASVLMRNHGRRIFAHKDIVLEGAAKTNRRFGS